MKGVFRSGGVSAHVGKREGKVTCRGIHITGRVRSRERSAQSEGRRARREPALRSK
jgi:hypothetical protein